MTVTSEPSASGIHDRIPLQPYLWGSARAFLNRGMEACRILPERPHEA